MTQSFPRDTRGRRGMLPAVVFVFAPGANAAADFCTSTTMPALLVMPSLATLPALFDPPMVRSLTRPCARAGDKALPHSLDRRLPPLAFLLLLSPPRPYVVLLACALWRPQEQCLRSISFPLALTPRRQCSACHITPTLPLYAVACAWRCPVCCAH